MDAEPGRDPSGGPVGMPATQTERVASDAAPTPVGGVLYTCTAASFVLGGVGLAVAGIGELLEARRVLGAVMLLAAVGFMASAVYVVRLYQRHMRERRARYRQRA